jgi:hypothetical protein
MNNNISPPGVFTAADNGFFGYMNICDKIEWMAKPTNNKTPVLSWQCN